LMVDPMSTSQSTPVGPDLAAGIPADDLRDGSMLAGHVGDQTVLLARQGAEFFAIDGTCTHYGGPLAEGLMVGDTVRCPWHHACFSLRTGAALRAPALSSVACWSVEQREGKVFVTERKMTPPIRRRTEPALVPQKIVIVGGGAAGFTAAQRLREEDYRGSIVMLSSDEAPPVDRPNLSKDYLAGNAPEEWVPLRPDDFYAENEIELRLKANVTAINVASSEVMLSNGTTEPYDRLLLATGAEPVQLSIPGADQPYVYTLRSLDDCRAIIAETKTARRAVVLGASFIGLEVAASLRARHIEVHVVAPEARPMERILGPQMGDFIRSLHEKNGVVFHLEDVAVAIREKRVRLRSGAELQADFVVVGIGVRPRTALAQNAALAIDHGVLVNEYLETSVPGIFAAGDIARWPDRHTGSNIRVEHWVVAEQQGQIAALNLLGQRAKFTAVPFFWSQHYDVPINYVGHADRWDELAIDGDIFERNCLLRYKREGRVLAVASIYRDLENLKAEHELELGAAV
jgi:NADPH-dependent 2,4-dienoyl-CoA reductase/sulfur reductase-like enzyme/nitrite reductase/ring-hydroxylating ferredoxin subunit